MGQFTSGITSIEIGAVADDGGMGTTLASLGKTLEGSCKFVMADPTITPFRSEETDVTEYQTTQQGDLTLEFSLMNADADALVSVFGGTATGTPKVYTPPAQFAILEKSIKVTTKTGTVINIVRAQLVGKVNAELSKKNIFLVDLKFTVLTPSKAGVLAWTFTNNA